MNTASFLSMTKALRLGFSVACGLALWMGTSGCGEPPPPTPIPAAEIPKTLENTFSSASPAMKEAMGTAARALEGGDQSVALESLEELSRQPDLTPEQRDAAARAALTVRGSILEAASKGDEAAKAYLEQQRARK
ncbi:MAG: hypothetical protein FJ379_15305 [Verrucomicrobia bacterium]|nr:hypothetical protein [Verrucomicrobiota bacterium]